MFIIDCSIAKIGFIQVNKEAQFKRLFNLSSTITDFFPVQGGRFINALVKNTLGNVYFHSFLKKREFNKINKIKKFEKFLVVADLNIGDAVIALSGVTAVKEIFPGADIDLIVKKSTKNLIEGNPEISNLFTVYNGAPFPNKDDLNKLKRIVQAKDYDLIINFSPMISNKDFGRKNVINYSVMAAELIKNEFAGNNVNNITYLAYNFIGNIFSEILPKSFGQRFKGSKLYLPDESVASAKDFLYRSGIGPNDFIVMYNPDASSIYTRMPFKFQVELLQKLIHLDCKILLGAGHVEKQIEYNLFGSLSYAEKQKVIIIPASTELDEYTALIDYSDVFISGDTGPLHLAAARKYLSANGGSMRNKTAVFSVFGSTPPKVYGYDSRIPGCYPANQDAISRIFIAQCSCRNITCINKLAKTCNEVRCFQNLSPREIVSAVDMHLFLAKRFKKEVQENAYDEISYYKRIG